MNKEEAEARIKALEEKIPKLVAENRELYEHLQGAAGQISKLEKEKEQLGLDMGGLDEELANAKKAIRKLEEDAGAVEIVRDDRDRLQKENDAFKKLKEALAEIFAPAVQEAIQVRGSRPLAIEDVEVPVEVTHAKGEPIQFSTSTWEGKILYVLVKDLKGGPAGYADISDALEEYGWKCNPNTFSSKIGQLTSKGIVVREGSTKDSKYHVPGKLKVNVNKQD